ncbi:MAG: pyruvate synthase [Candidatus Rokubacteria bacterium]|nr:pyruvate synthase [Candidatus Rokubacteria bacterium]
MSRELAAYRNLKDISREEFILPGTSVCGGCGGMEALRLAAKVLGDRVVYVNAAGCFTLLAVFPYTPFRGSWLYTTMGSAPAGAQGVRDALDVLIARGKVRPEDDVQVVVVAGDGATYDMALSSTSGAIWRNLDFWYFCYDNESYGNTGAQASSATPYGARTPTTLGAERRKDLFEIWRAHRPAYLATVSPRYPVDLSRKFEKAKRFKGPKLFLAAAPCPTGWEFDPAKTLDYGRLQVETGLFPLKEAVGDGPVVHTYAPAKRRPVEEYLRGQGRFRHLFEPVKQAALIARIQEDVDRYWARVEA